MYNVIHKMNNSLFGKGKEKILDCFYKNKSKELYFSEILRETLLTQNTTLKHLDNLQKNNIIISTKKIAHTFYKINNKNPQIYSIFAYFDYKRLNELPSSRKRAITEFLDILEAKPLIALIFGSTAKKTFTDESDIDILLVFNRKENIDKKIIKDLEATTGFHIQTFIIDYPYFKEQILRGEDKVITHAIKTGFLMIGHYYFYKEALK